MSDLTEIRSTDSGSLGILHLKRFWFCSLSGKQEVVPNEGYLSQIVLDGLELPIGETIALLNRQRPGFAEFEAWVLERHGPIGGGTREEINRAVIGLLEGCQRSYPLPCSAEECVFDQGDRACWEENGYVVLRQAVPREDCIALEQAIWAHLGMRPDEPEQWLARDKSFWIDDLCHPLAAKNRRSERVRRAFAEIWGSDELFLSVNRFSFNPPLGTMHRRYGPSDLHWDTSIALPMPFDVAGLLYLNDVREDQGAFQCVPGFHRRIGPWLDSLPKEADPRTAIIDAFEPVRIAGRAGDLVIWRHELPHGSSVNRADSPRFVQYLTMYPADREINPVWK